MTDSTAGSLDGRQNLQESESWLAASSTRSWGMSLRMYSLPLRNAFELAHRMTGGCGLCELLLHICSDPDLSVTNW